MPRLGASDLDVCPLALGTNSFGWTASPATSRGILDAFVAGGVITGVLDIDTIGPGRRADDVACLLAHLSTVQRMSAEQLASLTRLINIWLPAFEIKPPIR